MKTKSDRMTRLLKLFDEKTYNHTGKNHYAERALFHLLEKWKDRLPPLNHYFHKAFRQVDVTDDGNTDMAIWCLLNQSKLFWECLTIVRKRKQQ